MLLTDADALVSNMPMASVPLDRDVDDSITGGIFILEREAVLRVHFLLGGSEASHACRVSCFSSRLTNVTRSTPRSCLVRLRLLVV